jgi:hypothetical protein
MADIDCVEKNTDTLRSRGGPSKVAQTSTTFPSGATGEMASIPTGSAVVMKGFKYIGIDKDPT